MDGEISQTQQTPEAEVDYRDALRLELERRRARNPRYSLRAFALFLGISKTALSDTIAKKRHLSPRNRLRAAKRLTLPSTSSGNND